MQGLRTGTAGVKCVRVGVPFELHPILGFACLSGCHHNERNGEIPPSAELPMKTTLHPALIPQEAAGSSRLLPGIPATLGSESPALGGNPRLCPLSPQAP